MENDEDVARRLEEALLEEEEEYWMAEEGSGNGKAREDDNQTHAGKGKGKACEDDENLTEAEGKGMAEEEEVEEEIVAEAEDLLEVDIPTPSPPLSRTPSNHSIWSIATIPEIIDVSDFHPQYLFDLDPPARRQVGLVHKPQHRTSKPSKKNLKLPPTPPQAPSPTGSGSTELDGDEVATEPEDNGDARPNLAARARIRTQSIVIVRDTTSVSF